MVSLWIAIGTLAAHAATPSIPGGDAHGFAGQLLVTAPALAPMPAASATPARALPGACAEWRVVGGTGQIQRWTRYRGEAPLARFDYLDGKPAAVHVWRYDGAGRVTLEYEARNSMGLIGLMVVEHVYDGGGIELARVVTEYDKADPYVQRTTALRRDEQGRLVGESETTHWLDGSAEDEVRDVAYALDASGRLAEERWTVDGNLERTLAYAFDEAGRKTSVATRWANGDEQETTYRYDEAGRLVSEGVGPRRVNWTWDASGNPVSTWKGMSREPTTKLVYDYGCWK